MFIMSNMEKEDRILDELLSNMPKFTDHRPKEEVLMRVQTELEGHKIEDKRNKVSGSVSRWMPLVVSVASVILLTFLVSSYINEETTMKEESKADRSSKEESMRSMDVTEESVEEDKSIETNDSKSKEQEQTNEMTTMASIVESPVELLPLNSSATAVYGDSLNGGTVFHFSLVENAYSLPVTIIIPKEQIAIDFPDIKPNSLQLYERYAEMIDEEALGFNDYHPYKGYFVAEDNVLKHYLPEGHGYDTASGTSIPYWTSINEIFSDFDWLVRLNEDGTPSVWDQFGPLDEPTPLTGVNGRYYHKYVALNGGAYLTSNVNAVTTISEAFEQMKKRESDLYIPVIPNEVTYSYRDDNGTAVIQFDEPLDLTTLDRKDATLMIEAFALTAASFETEVKLENIVQQQWEEFDLTKTLPKPLGPNGFILQTKQ